MPEIAVPTIVKAWGLPSPAPLSDANLNRADGALRGVHRADRDRDYVYRSSERTVNNGVYTTTSETQIPPGPGGSPSLVMVYPGRRTGSHSTLRPDDIPRALLDNTTPNKVDGLVDLTPWGRLRRRLQKTVTIAWGTSFHLAIPFGGYLVGWALSLDTVLGADTGLEIQYKENGFAATDLATAAFGNWPWVKAGLQNGAAPLVDPLVYVPPSRLMVSAWVAPAGPPTLAWLTLEFVT